MKKLISKYQVGGWFPIGYDNNIYQSRIGILPEVKVVAKGDPRKMNDYYRAHSRERANAQESVLLWDDRDRLVLNTMLGVGATPVIAAHPLSFILGLTGGEGVNAGIRGVSKGKYKDFGEWSSNLITGDNSIAPLTSWLNPGYALAGASRPVVRGVETITRPYRLAKVVKEGLEEGLEEGIKNISNTIIENPAHNRFKLGDAEINNPNLFYRQGDGPLAEDLIESGIVRTKDTGKRQIIGTLNLTKPTQSNAMFNKGRVAFSPESSMGKNLITTSASDKMIADQPRTWTGDAVYINNWHLNPITKQEATAYIFEPGYGYRKYSTNSNTLPLKIVEKPLKKLIKQEVRGVTNALDGDLSSPFSQKNTTELLKHTMWDTYLANPTKSTALSPVSPKAVTEIDFPESSFNYYENSVFPRMLKDPDRVAITSNGSKGMESILLDYMRSIFEKKPYVGDEQFWKAYNNYRNAEGDAVGLYSFSGDNIFISPTTNGYSPMDHELRHRLQNYMPRTDNEDRLLRQAYSDTDGIISNYDMSQEWETMNLDGRQALIGNSNRDIKHQNSLLELTSKDYGYTINKLYNADGYWKRYIDKLTKDFDGPIEAWANTSEGRRKIHNWIQAMKYVGILSLPLIPSDNNSYANGGTIHIKPENRDKFAILKEQTKGGS